MDSARKLHMPLNLQTETALKSVGIILVSKIYCADEADQHRAPRRCPTQPANAPASSMVVQTVGLSKAAGDLGEALSMSSTIKSAIP